VKKKSSVKIYKYCLPVFLPLAALFILASAPDAAEAINYTPTVPIGEQSGSITIEAKLTPIGNYIKNIYPYALSGVGILATVVMMFGGFIWITAGGNASRVGEAKAWIGAALSGLVLALASYMLLSTINPALVRFRVTPIKPVEENVGGASTGAPLGSVDGWWFQSGIYLQKDDASTDLLNMLSCLRSNLPDNVGQISSISDSNYIGNLSLCEANPCPASCVHTCGSCHYGGGTHTGKSYAVDLGDEQNSQAIIEATQKCSAFVGYVENEGDHVHISSAGCPRN